MALRPRFQRTTQVQTGGGNPLAGQDAAALARSLEDFSAGRQDTLDQVAQEQGFIEGQQAGLEGEDPNADALTIRGRARNRGIIVSQQAALQTDIRDNVARIALENPNDPAAFQAGVAGMTEGLLKEASPELQPFITQRVNDYAGRAEIRVIAQQQAELEAEAVKDLQRGVEGLVEDARTASFEGDIVMEETRRQEINALVDEAVAAEFMTEGEGEQVRNDFERAVTEQEILGNFDRIVRNEGVDAGTAAIERWQNTKPSSVGLDVDDHNAITRQMFTMQNREESLQADDRARTRAAQSADIKTRTGRVNDAIDVLQDGFTPDQAQAQQVVEDLEALADPELAEDFDIALAIQSQVHAFRRASTPERQAALTELEQSLRSEGATKPQLALLDALRKTHTSVSAELERDPRGYVNRETLLDDKPLDFTDAQSLASSLGERAGTTNMGFELTGEPLPLLSAGEAEQLAAVYNNAEVEERVALLGIVTSGAGDQTLATLQQIDNAGHEQMALMGSMVMRGQGALARDVMRGQALLMEDPKLKPQRRDYQADVDDTVGAALGDAPGIRAQYLEAAFAKYAELKLREGDLTDVYDPKLFEQALEQVMPTGRFNGRRVAVPPGVSEDVFEDWVDGWSAADFEGVAGATGEELLDLVNDRGRLQELGFGRYGVRLDSAATGSERILVDENGEPIILELGIE